MRQSNRKQNGRHGKGNFVSRSITIHRGRAMRKARLLKRHGYSSASNPPSKDKPDYVVIPRPQDK